ncbi:MAG: hypothetical protein GXO89_03420 [Chlorobi bacterium]|nr:hypothetical protein [Chlorobiota bacterium]
MKITQEIKKNAEKIIADFNKSVFDESYEYRYVPRYKGGFLYLDRNEGGTVSPIARLKYTGDFSKWGFAIYKYSRDKYDPGEWMFPGSEELDGTILGALKAAEKAY